MRFVETFWTSTSLNSATDAENISASILQGKSRPVPNPILIILDTITARLVWMIFFFVEIVADTRQEEAASPSKIISVKNVCAMGDSSE